MEYIFFFGTLIIVGYLYLKIHTLSDKIKDLDYTAITHSHYLNTKVKLSDNLKEEIDLLDDSYDYALRRISPAYRREATARLLELKKEIESETKKVNLHGPSS